MVRIAGLPVWGPSDLISGTRAVLGWTDEAVGVVADLPQRVARLLDDVEALVARMSAAAERAEALMEHADEIAGVAASTIGRAAEVADTAAAVVAGAGEVAEQARAVVLGAGGITEGATGVVAAAGAVAEQARAVIDDAAGASRSATELLAVYEPLAQRAAPLARRFVEELSADEVEAAIRLVDEVPRFAEHMTSDIMPILATLDRVGPDLHELLDVLKDVRQAITGVPGFSLLRRMGQRQDERGEDDRRQES